jgi:demethylmenaquinone methyltransferase/2-methoxy-6-polyprenyl-1,4-benzoquinol methylase
MPDPKAVNSMFARIAGRYDLANRLLSLGVDASWRRRLVRAVHDARPRAVLDLATGSGDVAFALADGLPAGVRVVGMDFCQPMLDEAVKKQARVPRWRRIEFRQGDGLALPLPDGSFDAVTISFGLRNMADRGRALAEMRRVLRRGGLLCVLEFSQPQPWFRPIYFAYLKLVVPLVAGMLTGDRGAYEYLGGSIERFPRREELTEELRAAGFGVAQAVPLTFGIVALHVARG